MKALDRYLQTPLTQNIAVAVAYLLTAKLGFLLALEQTNATAVWPPTGIALAACLVFGFCIWPGIFLGAFFANMLVLATSPFSSISALLVSCCTASGNTLEAVMGAYLVKRFISGTFPFDRIQDTLRFILLGAFASPLISASIGTATFCIYGKDWSRSGQMWLTWWLGDAVGALIFAPLLLTWEKRGTLSWDKKRAVEAATLMVLFLLIEMIVFRLNSPLEYLVFPVLFWTAFRFGQFETSVTVALVMATFLLWTVKGFGPFVGTSLNNALLFLQSYLGVASASTLLLSTLTSVRNRAEEATKTAIRALRLVTDCNIALFQAEDENRLLQEICRLICETGGYRLAWVGFADQDTEQSVRPAAQWGYEHDYLQNIHVSWSDATGIGRGPTGTAIRTATTQVNQDCQNNPNMAPWREAALERGYQSSIALPLVGGQRVLGALMIYSAEPDAFSPDEVRLLEELACNLAYGIETIRERACRVAAEAADRLKSAFLATMSHELRTPLNSIIGFTGILLQGLGGPINDEQTKQLTMVKNSANHLLSLISDVLDISKIEAGQLTVICEPLDLKASIVKVVQIVRPMAEKKGLELTFDVAEDVGTASADERRVEQVLLNLLSNAVKFTEHGGISVRCLREAGSYVTTVTDTGIGIKDDDTERLFKPFHQVDNGLSRKYEGTGLGLSICKRLAELMGGEVGVKSEFGTGSTFWFTVRVGTTI